MDSRFPRGLSWALLVMVLAMPVWPFVSTWVGTTSGQVQLFKSLLVLFLVLVGFSTLIYLLVAQRKLLINLLSQRFVQVIILFAVIVLIAAVLSGASREARLAAVAMDLRYFLALVLALVSVHLDPKFWHRVMEKLPNIVIAIGVALSVLGLIQVFILPADFLTHFGYGPDTIAPSTSIDNTEILRAFTTLRGPNDFAAFLILPLLLAVYRFWRVKKPYFLLAIAIISAGLFVSSSRSAWLGAAVALGAMVFIGRSSHSKWTRKTWFKLAGAVIVGVVAIAATLNISYVRLKILHIDDNRDSSVITSNDAHIDATTDAVRRIIKTPLGCGAGCSGPASYYDERPARIGENYYLQIGEQYGIIGLIVWLVIMFMLVRRLYEIRRANMVTPCTAALIGYFAIGMLLHVFVDEPVAITWFVIAGVLIGGEHGKTQQKAT